MPRILVLGGTAEARHIVSTLAQDDDKHEVILSLAGVTPNPAKIDEKIALRLGGFGGIKGLVEWLEAEKINTLIDATHPYAEQISAHATEASAMLGIKRLTLWRDSWQPHPDDDFNAFTTWEELLGAIPSQAKVLVTAGQEGIKALSNRDDITLIARAMKEPQELSLKIHFIKAAPSQSWREEADLMQKHAITHLVAKDSGGEASYAKIIAARNLSLPVLLIARPAPPPPPLYSTPESLLAALVA